MRLIQLVDTLLVWYMSKVVIIMSVLLPLYCNMLQHVEFVASQLSALSCADAVAGELPAQVKKKLTQRQEPEKNNSAEVITQELKSAAAIYETIVDRSIPSCGKCSDLVLLLILERANKRFPHYWETERVPYVDMPYITKDKTLENMLLEADGKYEEKFEKKRPWWWVYSDEEILERIERAFETNTPYPEYPGNSGGANYRLGKAIAGYEMWFKKPPPEQDCSDKEWLARLENAILAETPILTEGEKNSLMAEYLKKFKRPITDYELSLLKVSLARRVSGKPNPQISVIREVMGATALYQPSAGRGDIVSVNPGSTELKLNLNEWLDFANTIHKYVGSWRNADCIQHMGTGGTILSDYWELRLFSANTDTEMPRTVYSYEKCPMDWDGLVDFMSGLETKIKNKGIKKQSKKTSVGQNHVRIEIDTPNSRDKLKIAKKPISANDRYIVGVMSDSTIVAANSGTVWLKRPLSEDLNNWNNIVAVSVGKSHIIGLKSNNTIVAVGPERYGQLNVTNWDDIVAVSAGRDHILGLRSTGAVVSTGLNFDGQCDVADWNNIVAISAGSFHTLGLKSDGTVASIGSNSSGQCNVDNWKNIIAISAGRYHSVGLRSDRTAVAVGRDWGGMCSKTQRWNNIIAVAAGDFHTVGLKSDGTVLAVGDNIGGQCDVSGWSNIIAIAASAGHTVGLKSDGTAMAVGNAPAKAVSGWSGLDTTGVRVSR